MTMTAMILSALLFVSPVSAQIADGTYEISYEMLEADNDNTSIADGYFTKPATLTVENGVQHIQLTLTGIEYIKSLSGPSGPVEVISEDTANDTRVVKFRVDGDLSQPVSMDMHIIVPDLYDQTHTARAVFDVSELPQAGEAAEQGTGEAGTEETDGDEAAGGAVENPPTGDNSSIGLYVLLMAGAAIALFAIWKFRPARN